MVRISRYEEKIRKNLEQYYKVCLGLKDHQARIAKRIDRQVGKQNAKWLNHLVPMDGKKVLDVGAGWGEFIVEAAKYGCKPYGIEPDRELLEISHLLLDQERVKAELIHGFGERMPYPDGFFDIVHCNAVIEHVNDVEQTIKEIARVTKKGGFICIATPNYNFPYEAHYKILYPPRVPKRLARVYLRLIGRKSHFINHINYVTYGRISKGLMYAGIDESRITDVNASYYALVQGKYSKTKKAMHGLLSLMNYYPDVRILVRK